MGTSARIAAPATMLLPGAATVYLGFNAGGFFPGTPAFVALVLIQVLILRVIVADRPFAGMTPAVAVVATLLGLYAAWTLASALWSDAPSRALIEFDRVLLYLTAVVLFGSIGADRRRVRLLAWGVAAGLCAVCLPGLVSRILPDVWPTEPNIANNRLSYPVTYWNALGIMAGVAIVLCSHLASRARGARLPRILGAAAVPPLACTLFFTFSRGAIAATILGVLAFVALARPRGLLAALVATGPATAVALVFAYRADALATQDPTSAEGIDQGKGVAAVLLLCVLAAGGIRWAMLRLDDRLARRQWLVEPRLARRASRGAAILAAVAFLAAGGPGWVGDEYDRFAEGSGATPNTDLRERLTDFGNNGRIDHWRAARRGFAEDRLHGSGAGTYQLLWERHRSLIFAVSDAHGLYFEVAGELGVVGLLLLVGAILTILAGLARRARGESRPLYAALFAAGLAWAVHAGIDWDWEMPAATLWLFAAGAAALGAPRAEAPAGTDGEAAPPAAAGAAPPMDGSWRAPIAVALVAVAVTPVLLAISQNRLRDASRAFVAGDCPRAVDRALDTSSVLAVRPEPYAIVGYCQVRRGFGQQGVRAMEKAVDRDPGNWEYRYGLAVARGAAGLDPRPESRRALALNPREPIVRSAARRFERAGARSWPAAAEAARREIYESGLLSLP
ncbi:MAG TPA: O-antigen ligase family protein [Thermoleophilaceae bacterium]|jgi:O-antigen ligase